MATGILSSIIRLTDMLAVPLRRHLAASSSSSTSPKIVETDLVELKNTLTKIDNVLNDAEKREVKDESVKLWLRELRGVAYDAEDLLDEFEYELLRGRVEAGARMRDTRKRKLDDDESGPMIVMRPSPLDEPSFRDQMSIRMKEIKERLDEIAREKEDLHLREEDGTRRVEYKARPVTSSYVDQSEVYGRDEACSLLVELLLKSDGNEESNLSVIPIVGMPGVGKTTLAQLIYNDSRVCGHFGLRAWVCGAPGDFHVTKLVKAIIESITKSLCSVDELDELRNCLKDVLQDKRFLIVLDNVWNEDQILWESLSSSLCSDVPGCRVIVTTRNENVAEIVQANMPVCRLNCLPDDDCWQIFRRQAFGGGRDDSEAVPDLVAIGKMIVKKCKGLPLAVKALGGLLRYETDQEVWTDVLESDLWDIEEAGDEILPALKLSYQHLPVHLRRCFVYCSIFPKNVLFKRNHLVLLWMVQGLIHHQKDQHEQPEDTGCEYFEDLICRSFFQKSAIEIGEEEKFMMHDLVHDLARNLSGEEFYTTEFTDLSNVSAMVRHASVASYSSEGAMQFHSADKPIAMRSLLLIHRIAHESGRVGMPYDSNLLHLKIPRDVFVNLKCLRAVDLGYTDIEALPDSIGGLKQLRYLSLRNTKIQKLPESVCKLYHLQILDLDYCSRLKELPGGIGSLLNLQHLDLPTMDSSFICIPSGIANLTGLQELAAFNVGADSRHCSIGELKHMIHLGGDLYISGLKNVARGWDAKEANMESKKNIQRLTLDWYIDQSDYKCSHNLNTSVSQSKIDKPWTQVEDEEAVLQSLRPHSNLVVLEIRHYGGMSFPRWLGDPSFAKLVTVKLFMCNHSKVLPWLGKLPSLKNLHINGMESIRCIRPASSATENFLALEVLNLHWLPELEELSEVVLPQLAELSISKCHKLKNVPQSIAPALKKLDVSECEKLAVLPTSASLANLYIGGEFQDQIWTCIPNLTHLNSLEVAYCSNLTCLPLHNLPSLRSLEINSCSELVSIDCQSCPETVAVAAAAASSSSSTSVNGVGLHNLVSLESLKIEECPMVRFLEDERFPSTLKLVEITCCEMLMEWCEGVQGQSQLSQVPEVLVTDFGVDQIHELIKEEMGSEEEMDED